MQQKLLDQATPGIGSTAEPLMKTKWEYLCENLTKEGDIIDKYDAYQACPLCSSESTEVHHPSYKYGDEPQLEDVDVEYDMWTLGCPSCGFEITYERTTVAKFVKIPEQIPEHLDGVPFDYVSDEHEVLEVITDIVSAVAESFDKLPLEGADDDNDNDDPQPAACDGGWKFSRKTGWQYPQYESDE